MKKPELVTVKVTKDTRRMLRMLAAHHEVLIYEVAESLCWADMKKHRIGLRTERLAGRVSAKGA